MYCELPFIYETLSGDAWLTSAYLDSHLKGSSRSALPLRVASYRQKAHVDKGNCWKASILFLICHRGVFRTRETMDTRLGRHRVQSGCTYCPRWRSAYAE